MKFTLGCAVFALSLRGISAQSFHNNPTSAWSLCKSTSPYPDLLTASLEEITYGLGEGFYTTVDLVSTYIARIEETQPILRALIEVNPYALEEAAAADAARQAGNATGSLLGIPIIVKDNIATARPK